MRLTLRRDNFDCQTLRSHTKNETAKSNYEARSNAMRFASASNNPNSEPTIMLVQKNNSSFFRLTRQMFDLLRNIGHLLKKKYSRERQEKKQHKTNAYALELLLELRTNVVVKVVGNGGVVLVAERHHVAGVQFELRLQRLERRKARFPLRLHSRSRHDRSSAHGDITPTHLPSVL
jgi:hypothetical protein